MNLPQPYPLAWPEGIERQKSKAQSRFKTTLGAALKNVTHSLTRFGSEGGKPVAGIVISSNVTLGADRPTDTGVAVWFMWDDALRCIAVDRYPKVEDNLQAIHHILEARITELRHGGLHIVRQTFKGFIGALPPPAIDWRSILGFEQSNTLPSADAITERYRARARSIGAADEDGLKQINLAKAAAMKAIGK